MASTIQSVYLAAPGDVALRALPYPQKQAHEALIKVETVGICGSDIGAFRGLNPLVTYPRILGHEVVGTVLESGSNSTIVAGDRVIVDPYLYCGQCYPCQIGRTNCCENLKVIGVHIDGGMREVFTHPANMLHKLPDNLPFTLAVLAEPLTIALHALHRTKLKAGEHVAIIGAGAIGLMAALAALSYNAIPILIDIVDERLKHAQLHGVVHAINPTLEDTKTAIHRITQGRMAEVVMEASGANVSVRNTLDFVSFAGRIALTGWPKQETPLPTNLITLKEIDICGSRTSAGEFQEALQLLAQGTINPAAILSKVIAFNELPEAIRELSEFPERHLKINAIL